MMKDINYLVIVFFIFLISCSKPPLFTTHLSKVVMVDGSLNEWDSSFTYDKSTKLLYSISNDNKNLYLALKIKDEKMERKVMATGLTLWIDTTGKYKEKIGVKFPLGDKEKKKNGNFLSGGVPDKQEMRAEFLKTNNQLEVKGFSILKDYGNEFYRTSSKSKTGINAALGYDSIGTLSYEIEIPLSWLFEDGKVEGRMIGIKFLSGSFDMMDRNDALGQSAADRTQGGMSGNGMGGRGRPTADPKVLQEMQYMSETTEVRLKVILN